MKITFQNRLRIIEFELLKIQFLSNKPVFCLLLFQQRDDRRRANHNEIERRRRDKINNWIHELNKIIPAEHMNSPPSDSQQNKQNGGTGDNLSKGGILAKACEYITRLKDTSDKLTECLAEKDQILLENLQLKESINQLLTENKRLQSELQFALATNVKIES